MTSHPSPSYFLLQENCPLSAQSKIPPNEPRHESNYVPFSYIHGVIAMLLIKYTFLFQIQTYGSAMSSASLDSSELGTSITFTLDVEDPCTRSFCNTPTNTKAQCAFTFRVITTLMSNVSRQVNREKAISIKIKGSHF